MPISQTGRHAYNKIAFNMNAMRGRHEEMVRHSTATKSHFRSTQSHRIVRHPYPLRRLPCVSYTTSCMQRQLMRQAYLGTHVELRGQVIKSHGLVLLHECHQICRLCLSPQELVSISVSHYDSCQHGNIQDLTIFNLESSTKPITINNSTILYAKSLPVNQAIACASQSAGAMCPRGHRT